MVIEAKYKIGFNREEVYGSPSHWIWKGEDEDTCDLQKSVL